MTITEVSETLDIPKDTLRFYERIGLIPKIKRLKNGMRTYDEEVCQWIQLVHAMRAAGSSMEVLIEYCCLAQQGSSTISTRRELLSEERLHLLNQMEALQETLNRLEDQILRYEIAEKSGNRMEFETGGGLF